ncbi:VgrG-related protein [Solihabitans fulvus]|uniref:VgrG-related protein n=1 Tax=Solihabitans fulvus TaxID=1892852 RepID=A0A5B2X456_9PSEU|nr:VgrG-related protein [Solihabitans fulvus]KAA2258087.1 VgrG-related protein [Solihabitans fulvus]
MSGEARSFTADPVVSVAGPLPPIWQEQLVRTVVDENVGLPSEATLTFRDPYHELLTQTGITIGLPLKVSVVISEGQAAKQLFFGEVTSLELDIDSTGSFTVVRAMSRAHRLLRGRRVVAFRNMTAAAIVRKVAGNAGLATGRVEAPAIVYPGLTQAGVSDWDFLQDLAAQLGAVVRVDDTGHLDFIAQTPAAGAPTPGTPATASPFVLEYGRNLMALRAVLSAVDQVDSVQVRSWNVDAKWANVANRASTPSSTVRPGLTGPGSFGPATALVTGTPYGTHAEATAAAAALAESMSSGVGELEAVVEGEPQLRAGTPVTLSNAGADFSGRYTASAVQHVLDADSGYRTTVLVSATPDRTLAGLTAGATQRARAPRFPGVATAIVTNIREPGRSERGQVKLKFPWLDEMYESDWVRTVQWGGQGGGVFSPEVNDEVLVGFEQGSIDRPYVLGGLYNGVDAPSPHHVPLIDSAGKVNRRSLVSRKGHRLELVDGLTGPPGVRVASGDDRLEIRLDDAKKTIDITVFSAGGTGPLSSIKLSPRGIALDAGTGSLTLSAGSISIDAGAGSLTQSAGSISVDGRASVEIDGGALARLRGRLIEIN